MPNAILRWGLPIATLITLAPLAGLAVALLRAGDGGPATTLLLNEAPVMGILVLVGVGVLAGIAGLAGGVVADLRTGWLCTGFVLAWAAWRTGQMDHVLALEPGGGWALLALEGVLAAAVLGMIASAIEVAGRGSEGGVRAVIGAWTDPGSLAGAGAACVVASAALLLVVPEPLRGQAVVGSALAAIAAGAAGALVAASISGRSPGVAPIATGVALAGALAPIAAMFTVGDPAGAALAGELTGLGRVQPLDLAAAAMLGTPIGMNWASGAVARQVERAAARG